MVDVFDGIALLGLLMLGIGFWMVLPAAALIIVGSLLLVFSVLGAKTKKSEVVDG